MWWYIEEVWFKIGRFNTFSLYHHQSYFMKFYKKHFIYKTQLWFKKNKQFQTNKAFPIHHTYTNTHCIETCTKKTELFEIVFFFLTVLLWRVLIGNVLKYESGFFISDTLNAIKIQSIPAITKHNTKKKHYYAVKKT